MEDAIVLHEASLIRLIAAENSLTDGVIENNGYY